MASQMTTIGKITSPFGLKGEVKVYPYSDFLERCYLLKKVQLEGKGFCGFKVVRNAYIHKNMWIFHFADCHSRDEAQKMCGLLVKIFTAERVPLPAGTYYLDEIIGLEAYSVDGKKLGCVKDIIKTGSNDVYLISNEDKRGGKDNKNSKEILVPALKSVVKEIDIKSGYLILALPPGLL